MQILRYNLNQTSKGKSNYLHCSALFQLLGCVREASTLGFSLMLPGRTRQQNQRQVPEKKCLAGRLTPRSDSRRNRHASPGRLVASVANKNHNLLGSCLHECCVFLYMCICTPRCMIHEFQANNNCLYLSSFSGNAHVHPFLAHEFVMQLSGLIFPFPNLSITAHKYVNREQLYRSFPTRSRS